ncbi:MAG: nucleoside hydrolase-like domain-containing protein [Planctomycetota bacterium]
MQNRFPFRLLIALFFMCVIVPCNLVNAQTRLIVMADMGNEPDEVQQMTHLMMYANCVELEGLIACSGKYLHADRSDKRTEVHPELFHEIVDGYEKVVGNLRLHADGWPEPDQLRSIIKAGTAEYGIEAVEPGRSNEASRLMEAAILRDDPRKLYIVGNAGTNTLAQALVDLNFSRTAEEMTRLTERLIVFENGAQDNSGAWIAHHYPAIAWHRSNHQTYAYGGPGAKDQPIQGPYTWEPFERTATGQNEWAEQHIMTAHGALGECFPPRFLHRRLYFIEGGGTIPWMGLVNQGLTDPQKLWWGGWSGRFSRKRHKNIYSRHQDIRSDEREHGDFQMFEADSESDTWTDPSHREEFTGRYVPVWRFRRAMFNDFRGRMDWCLQSYENSNHNPIAAINGDVSSDIVHRSASPGENIALDASASIDPDGDELEFRWWVYSEAGTYSGEVRLSSYDKDSTSFRVPADANGAELHVVLTLRDRNEIVPMCDYRRVVIKVSE